MTNKPNKTQRKTTYLYKRNGMDPLEIYHEWEENQIVESNGDNLDENLDDSIINEKELHDLDEDDYLIRIEPEAEERRKKKWKKPVYRKGRKI